MGPVYERMVYVYERYVSIEQYRADQISYILVIVVVGKTLTKAFLH